MMTSKRCPKNCARFTPRPSRPELKKTADLTRHWETLLEYVREHSNALDQQDGGFDRRRAGGAGEFGEEFDPGRGRINGHCPAYRRYRESRPENRRRKIKGIVGANCLRVDQTYLGVYLDEAEQNTTRFNDDLVILEKNPDDPDLINDLFRVIHTIKGSSAMMNISSVKGDRARDGEHPRDRPREPPGVPGDVPAFYSAALIPSAASFLL